MIHCVSTLPAPLLFLSYDLQLSSAYSTHQAEQNKQFSPLFPNKIPIPLIELILNLANSSNLQYYLANSSNLQSNLPNSSNLSSS